MSYRSPTAGYLQAGWDQPLNLDGVPIPISDALIASPWCQVIHGEATTVIRYGDKPLTLGC